MIKEKITEEYLRRTRKLPETKLYNKNLFKKKNTRVVPLVRYLEPFSKWNVKKTTRGHESWWWRMRSCLLRDGVDRLYMSREKKRKTSRQHWRLRRCVNAKTQRLHEKVQKNIEVANGNTENMRMIELQ